MKIKDLTFKHQFVDDLKYISVSQAAKEYKVHTNKILKAIREKKVKSVAFWSKGKTRPGKYVIERASLEEFLKNFVDNRRRGEITKFSHLTPKEKWIYTHVWRNNEIGSTPVTVGEAIGITRQGACNKMVRMIRAGLIKKIDRRYYIDKILEID